MSGAATRRFAATAIAIFAGLGAPAAVLAGEVHVAVAANFSAPAEEIAEAFTAATGHRLILSFGASGALFAQIAQAAPFDVFLSADTERPERAITDGLGVAGTDFVYAVGRLALYAPGREVADGMALLEAGNFEHVAIADPASAPYGAAAVDAIDRMGPTQALGPKLVVGGTISQALQFVESGNAELGFVALSQVAAKPSGEWWLVPSDLHEPIEQGAVLLQPGAANVAAVAFLDFLKGPDAKRIVSAHGYEPGREPH